VNSGNLANPVSQRLTVAIGALLQWTLSSLATCGTAMEKQNNQQNPKNTNEQQLFLETRKGNIRSSGKPSTAKEVENFWREIYGKEVQYNEEACWIKKNTNKIQACNGAQ